jgi:hypothetical protein
MSATAPVVTISGSYRKHLERILVAKRRFEELGAVVLRPHTEEIVDSEGALVRLQGDPDDVRAVQLLQLQAIAQSDLVYVVNPGGYVGASATLEVGDARRGGALIVTAEPAFEDAVAAVIGGVGNPEEALALLAVVT